MTNLSCSKISPATPARLNLAEQTSAVSTALEDSYESVPHSQHCQTAEASSENLIHLSMFDSSILRMTYTPPRPSLSSLLSICHPKLNISRQIN